MNRQYGAANSSVIALIVCVVVFFLGIGTLCAGSYVNAYNYGNEMEVRLKTKKENNRNVLAQYGQKVLEVAQVPDIYRKDLIELTKTAIQSRYGEDGSKATFQMIKEQNPNLDPSLYKQIQQVIEAGRNDFQQSQTEMLDIRRQYETALGSFWKGLWMKFAGYPKINLSDYEIVSTDRADSAFKNKKEEGPIKLR